MHIALRHPFRALQYMAARQFGSQAFRSYAFYLLHYGHLNREQMVDYLRQYWLKYRRWQDIVDLLGPFKGKRILDVGCGLTSVLNLMPEASRDGIDPVIDYLRKRFDLDPDVNWQAGTANALPFGDQVFDIAFCTNGLDHYPDPAQTLKEISRVVTPGGSMVFTINLYASATQHCDKSHPHCLTRESFAALLSDYKTIFRHTSPIPAQVSRFVDNRIKTFPGAEELVVVVEDAAL